MNAKQRSWSGAALAAVMVPVVIGLLACLPVPIGDPERSSIDPDLTGMWVLLGDGPGAVVLLEPYDKRSWLMTSVHLESGADSDDLDIESYEDLIELLEQEDENESGVSAVHMLMYKVWRTRLGNHWFMTWEGKGQFDEDRGFEPEIWFAMRIQKAGPDKFTLRLINPDFDGFDDIKETRRAFEKVIKKNSDNDDMYLDDDDMTFIRVRPEHHEMFNDVLNELVGEDV